MELKYVTTNTYSFTAGLKLQHHYKEFSKPYMALSYAKCLKKKLHTKHEVCVQRYAFTVCGQAYWDTIAFV